MDFDYMKYQVNKHERKKTVKYRVGLGRFFFFFCVKLKWKPKGLAHDLKLAVNLSRIKVTGRLLSFDEPSGFLSEFWCKIGLKESQTCRSSSVVEKFFKRSTWCLQKLIRNNRGWIEISKYSISLRWVEISSLREAERFKFKTKASENERQPNRNQFN